MFSLCTCLLLASQIAEPVLNRLLFSERSVPRPGNSMIVESNYCFKRPYKYLLLPLITGETRTKLSFGGHIFGFPTRLSPHLWPIFIVHMRIAMNERPMFTRAWECHIRAVEISPVRWQVPTTNTRNTHPVTLIWLHSQASSMVQHKLSVSGGTLNLPC